MKKVIKIFQTVRNNWKKSLFATSVLVYGGNYAKNSYDTRQMMRRYCEEAAKYGEEPILLSQPSRRITVVLNPVAKKRKCKELYEKYCAPLLHLSGACVNVVQTEYAGQAKELPQSLDPLTDAIVIAGGDGTLNETVTGLLRRADGNWKALQHLPIAVLPLGRTNSFANAILGDKEEVRALADATMAVIDGSLRQVDVIKIQPLQEEGRPIYSVARIEWGAHRDVRARRDKYWLFGPLREYISYLMAGSPQMVQWICQYSEPCKGCLKCSPPEGNDNKRWWHAFTPRAKPAPHLLVANEQCGLMRETSISTVHFTIETETVHSENTDIKAPHVDMKVGPSQQGKFALTSEGWKKLKGVEPAVEQILPVRNLNLIPMIAQNLSNKKGEEAEEEEGDNWFSIDNEDFEVKPIALELLPKTLKIFEPRRDRK